MIRHGKNWKGKATLPVGTALISVSVLRGTMTVVTTADPLTTTVRRLAVTFATGGRVNEYPGVVPELVVVTEPSVVPVVLEKGGWGPASTSAGIP